MGKTSGTTSDEFDALLYICVRVYFIFRERGTDSYTLDRVCSKSNIDRHYK